MRWTLYAPLIALAACIGAALVLLAPVLAAAPWLAPVAATFHIKAADDSRPRRPLIGERARTLAELDLFAGASARQYWIEFARRDAPPAPIGALTAPAREDARLFINGLQLRTAPIRSTTAGLLGEAPPEGLQIGPNRIEAVAQPGPQPRGLFLGPLEVLTAAHERLDLVLDLSARAAALAGSAGALLGFLLAFASRGRAWLFQPSLLALTLATQGAVVWLAPAGPGLLPWTWLAELLPAAAAVLLLSVTAGRGRWPGAAVLGFRVAAGGGLACAAAALFAAAEPQAAGLMAHWGSGLAVMAGAGTSLWLLFVDRRIIAAWSPLQRATGATAALALLAGAAAGVEVLGVWGLFVGAATAGVATVATLAAWTAWAAWRAFLDAEAGLRRGLGLGRVVREQQARLAAQQAELDREAGRRAVMEERERISRDIHDGVGGALTSLLLQARTGDLKGEALEEGLAGALTELRLMIDALDHAPDTLDGAFPVLQTRLAPAFAAAGIALDWRCGDLSQAALRDPQALLQVFRILQEACTNAIRHSGATTALVAIDWDPDARALDVTIEDDGKNGTASAGGNGLRNMANRALTIGAELSAGPREGGGWRVHLRAPGRAVVAA